MARSKITSITEDQCISEIVNTLQAAEPGAAPFVLVVGAGFSRGLVPMAREVVEESVPLWMEARRTQQRFDGMKSLAPAERRKIAATFWEQFSQGDSQLVSELDVDANTGLPRNFAAAYQAAFDPQRIGGLGAPADARRFQRDVMTSRLSKLNAAHFFLASILGVQPWPGRPSPLFRTVSGFCRLILTTNFDPFLQIALQMVNQLYVVTDSPEIRISDEIRDEDNDVVQLVYVHGSVHRRRQIADEEGIADQKSLNSEALAPILRDHGVIVLGYSGWDDVIVDALDNCRSFDHRLFWCDVKQTPEQLLPQAQKILQKRSTFYVPIRDAGAFLSKLSIHVVKGLPRLLENPITQLRERLDMLDLTDLDAETPRPTGGQTKQTPEIEPRAFVNKLSQTLERLRQFEKEFVLPPALGALASGAPTTERQAQMQADEAQGAVRAATSLLSSADLAYSIGNYNEVLRLCDEVLAIDKIGTGDLVTAHSLRGRALSRMGDPASAADEWTFIINHKEASPTDIAGALLNRGLTWDQRNQHDNEILDYSQVIDGLTGAPVEQVAKALFNRAVSWSQKGEPDKALADYTRVIEGLPGAPIEQVAMSLFNRALAWRQSGELDKELADYTRVIERLPDAPVEQVAKALVNRGVAWRQKGQLDSAVGDYTRVIERLPGAPAMQMATALVNRGVAWRRKGEPDKEFTDYTRVVEDFPGAPREQLACALCNRGWIHYQRKEHPQFLQDTEASLRHFDGVAASFNLGLALLACNRDAEAMTAYERAAGRWPDQIETAGLADLAEAQKDWLSTERAAPIVAMLRGRMGSDGGPGTAKPT